MLRKLNKKLTCFLCRVWYTKTVDNRRKEVIANMTYEFSGVDVDDLIFGDHDEDSDSTTSER